MPTIYGKLIMMDAEKKPFFHALLVLATLLSSLITLPVWASLCASPNGETLAAIVRVSTTEGDQSSGVVIGHNRVLTVAHAINPDFFTSVEIGNEFQAAEVLTMDAGTDLALLSVPTAGVKPIQLSTRQLSLTEPVWAVGYPLANQLTISSGNYKRRMNGRLYTSTHTDAGSSGGGLLVCNVAGQYELAGLVYSYVAYYNGEHYVNTGDATSITVADILNLPAFPLHKSRTN